MSRFASFFFAIALAACTTPRTQVMVVVDADPLVRSRTTEVEIRIWGGPDRGQLSEIRTHNVNAPEWPIRVPIVPEGNDHTRFFRVQAIAFQDGVGEIATARAVSSFARERTVALRVLLEDACIEQTCGGLDETCTGGECVVADVDANELPDFVDAEPECGNGDVERGEECDDGDTSDGDGCSSVCRVEVVCGDGVVQPGEECDDGNTDDGDGCSSFCQSEGSTDCGNGTIDPGEQCDAGLENGLYASECNATCDGPGERCGDGIVTPNFEECDPLDPETQLQCTEKCLLIRGCGDGIFEPDLGEQCEDGNADACDGCNEFCQEEACGNGNVDCGEECDPMFDPECTSDCRRPACGDGTREAGEICFPASITVDDTAAWQSVAVGDFDGDAVDDIVAATTSELVLIQGFAGGPGAPLRGGRGASGLLTFPDSGPGGRDQLVVAGDGCFECVSLASPTFSPVGLGVLVSGVFVSAPADLATGSLSSNVLAASYGPGSTSITIAEPSFSSGSWSQSDSFVINDYDEIAILPATASLGSPALVGYRVISGDVNWHLISGNTVETGVFVGANFGSSTAGDLVIGDMQSDGEPDVVLVTGDSVSAVRIYVFNAGGVLISSARWPAGDVVSARLAYVDGDPHLDLVVATSTNVWVGLNDGFGDFADTATPLASCSPIHGMDAGDFNGDGHVDVIAATGCGVTVSYGNP